MHQILTGATDEYHFWLTDSSTGAGYTGAESTCAVSICKAAGTTFTSISPTVTQIGSGCYSFDFTAAQTDTVGVMSILVTQSGADPWRDTIQIIDNPVDVMLAADASSEDDFMNTIADHVLKRAFGNCDDSSNGDGGTSPSTRTLLGVVARQMNRTELSGTAFRIYDDDDSTIWEQMTATIDGNNNITELDPD